MYICIGSVVNTHGLNGDLRLKENLDISEFFDKFDKIMLKSGSDYIDFDVKKIERHNKKGWILSLSEIDTISKAESFIWRDIYVPKFIDIDNKQFEIFDDEIEFYTFDEGKRFTLFDIVKNGVDNLLSFRDEKGKTMLIPEIDHFVVSIDYESGEIILQNTEGLIDI